AASNPALFPSGAIVLGGSGAGRSVTLTPAAGQTGTALVTLTVSDGAASASAGFNVTVTADPNLVVARRLLGGVVLDGTPSEAVWTWAAGANQPVIGSPNNDTSFAVLWDETYLYVAARVLDSSLH
ncbi:MAG TPA: hypothetical protein PKE47_17520, partial [Verrucomicrobiota bacterium]|nr:hypothetical protein [Verrucomicrobiota bacterium]